MSGTYKTPRKQNLKTLTDSEDESADLDTAIVGDAELETQASSKRSTRHSTRRPSPTKKYQAYQRENGSRRQEHVVVNYAECSDDESQDVNVTGESVSVVDQEEEDNLAEVENAARPTSKDLNLIQSEYNVAGSSLFGFNTPKKRDAMALAALNAMPRTPKTPKTPRLGVKTPDTKRKRSAAAQPKTPSHVRTRVKNRG